MLARRLRGRWGTMAQVVEKHNHCHVILFLQ
jgi:hypothetical protein